MAGARAPALWAAPASPRAPAAAAPSPGGVAPSPGRAAAGASPGTSPGTAGSGAGGSVAGGGGGGAKSAERARFERSVRELEEFVRQSRANVASLDADIARLEARRATVLKSRADFPELHRLEVGLSWLRECRRLVDYRVDEELLEAKLGQMVDYYAAIPPADKTDLSLRESWNAVFDANSVVPKPLAKDHCENCHCPLVLNKKQALLRYRTTPSHFARCFLG